MHRMHRRSFLQAAAAAAAFVTGGIGARLARAGVHRPVGRLAPTEFPPRWTPAITLEDIMRSRTQRRLRPVNSKGAYDVRRMKPKEAPVEFCMMGHGEWAEAAIQNTVAGVDMKPRAMTVAIGHTFAWERRYEKGSLRAGESGTGVELDYFGVLPLETDPWVILKTFGPHATVLVDSWPELVPARRLAMRLRESGKAAALARYAPTPMDQRSYIGVPSAFFASDGEILDLPEIMLDRTRTLDTVHQMVKNRHLLFPENIEELGRPGHWFTHEMTASTRDLFIPLKGEPRYEWHHFADASALHAVNLMCAAVPLSWCRPKFSTTTFRLKPDEIVRGEYFVPYSVVPRA